MKRKHFFPQLIFWTAGVLILVFMVSSCKKDDPDAGAFEMSFTANGTKVKYTTQGALVATFSNSGNQHIGVFSGYDINTNFHVQVYDDKSIVAQSYTGYSTSNFVLVGVLMGYKDDTETLYSQGGGDVVVNISSITDMSVSGTFSGTLKATGKPDVLITDGKFMVQRFN